MKNILTTVAVCFMAAMAFAAQCAATTKKGTQCKRQASPDSEFCWQHGGKTKAERGEGKSAPSARRRPRPENASGEEAPSQIRRKSRPVNVDEDSTSRLSARRRPRPKRSVDVENTPPQAGEGGCQTVTEAGMPCRRKAQAGGRYCAQHAVKMGASREGEAAAARTKRRMKPKATSAKEMPAPSGTNVRNAICQGKTKGGEPCRRKAKPGSNFCWQHAN